MSFLFDSNTKRFTEWKAFAVVGMEEILDSASASSSIGVWKPRSSGKARC